MIEYDIWTHAPDLTVTPSEGRTVRPDVSSFAVAPEFVSFPEARSERVFKLGFAWDVPRDWHLAKAFWHDHGGRHAVFLMPSWKRDFRMRHEHPDHLQSLIRQAQENAHRTTRKVLQSLLLLE